MKKHREFRNRDRLNCKGVHSEQSSFLIWIVFGAMVYRCLLDIIYIMVIHPKYNSMGFSIDYSICRYLFSLVPTIIAAFVVGKLLQREQPSSWLLATLIIVNFIPALVLWAYKPAAFIVYYFVYWVALILAYYLLACNGGLNALFNYVGRCFLKVFRFIERVCRLFLQRFHIPRSSNYSFRAILLSFWEAGLLIAVIFIWVIYAKFHIQLDFFDVYGIRAQAKNFQLPSLLKYLFSFSKVLFPVFAGVAIYNRRIGRVMLWSIGALIVFFIDGSKSVMLSLGTVVFVSLLSRRYKVRLLWLSLIASLCIIVFLGIIENFVFQSYWIAGAFVRRGLFVPSGLNYPYYDFFSHNQPDLFRSAVLRRFGAESPYSLSIPNTIGLYFFNNINTAANNGLFSDAFANLGHWGMVVMPVLIAATFLFMDYCLEGMPLQITIIPVALFTMTFISSSYFTVLLTHGFLPVCLYFKASPYIVTVIPSADR